MFSKFIMVMYDASKICSIHILIVNHVKKNSTLKFRSTDHFATFLHTFLTLHKTALRNITDAQIPVLLQICICCITDIYTYSNTTDTHLCITDSDTSIYIVYPNKFLSTINMALFNSCRKGTCLMNLKNLCPPPQEQRYLNFCSVHCMLNRNFISYFHHDSLFTSCSGKYKQSQYYNKEVKLPSLTQKCIVV